MPPTKLILCVDDDEDTCFMLKALLGSHGYEVQTANDPQTALALATRTPFDLYVLDTRLQEHSGLELCHELLARTPAVPLIFYSGAAFDDDRAAGLCAGATAYVTKPDLDSLLATVKRLLRPPMPPPELAHIKRGG